ncbi:MAG: phospho-N-acetylmuramoyl-pentapeptide-transferase [Sedimentisphaerales bacterium]|nr:phospho-N-acetylmuramoyl-pentapeptide-transferase [Sedimentisphaerales bacterium]
MIYWLCKYYRIFLQEHLHFYAWQAVSFRAVLAILTSLIVSIWWGPRVIRWLIKMKVGDIPEFDHAALNELTADKKNTPTMGGIFIIGAVGLSALLWCDLANPFVQKGLILMILLGFLGGWDDYLKLTAKIKHRSRDGLHMWEKLVLQIGWSVLIAWSLFRDFQSAEIPDGLYLWLPFYKHGLSLGYAWFLIMSVIVITGSSNAVNLSDGMDGLAAGCMAIVSLVFAGLCYLASEYMSYSQNLSWANYLGLPQITGAGELGIICAAMCGASLGFLWFNCHPAQVFMGDIGSLTLGGLIGYAAVVTRHELLLPIVGGVFVMEAVSVIIQVTYFKMSGGKRVFRCAPIHHHFHLGGWSEPQVVIRFWLLGIAFAALALATLKLR